jgi:adenylate cyclase
MPPQGDTEARWRAILTAQRPNAHAVARRRRLYGLLPSTARCKVCHRPFGTLWHWLGIHPSNKNPRFCDVCIKLCDPANEGGAEVEISMLFADARGSTRLAEQMSAAEFSRLMNRFYRVATEVLIRTDAYIDKFVGDEVIGLYVPWFTGPDQNHARAAINAAQELLRVTGHGDRQGPWLPIGVGVHTGPAFVGTVKGAEDTANDVTALGDNVNITARLASNAGAGEALISEAAYVAAGLDPGNLEPRELELKGKRLPVSVRVFKLTAP